jgi:hypothetical protein
MFSKTFVAALLAAVAVAQTNSENPTSAPATGEKVPGCKPYTLKWNPTTKGTVSIEIISGASQGTLVPVGKVATGIANSGSFVWTPEAALGANAVTGYKIYDDATGTFQYSVPFSVDGSTCKGVVSTPSASKDGYPTSTPPVIYSSSSSKGYPTSTPVMPSSSSCTTTSTVYVPPHGTGYPAPPHNGTTYAPAPPPTTLYPTGTGVPVPPKTTATPPPQQFPGAGSALRAGMGLVGAAAAAVLLL